MAKKALGRGLGSLIPETPVFEPNGDAVLMLPITEIRPNAAQPRRVFDEEKLAELAASIKEVGLLQPITVAPLGEGRYELVMGERRWRAAQLAGKSELPCIVRQLDEQQRAELALIENMQREDLNPIEEAEGLQRLEQEFGYSQTELAAKVGKSRPYISNALRLLKLSPAVKKLTEEGRISAGHARALLAVSPEAAQEALARRVLKEDLSVRQIEQLLRARKKTPRKRAAEKQQPIVREIEDRLQQKLGTKVSVRQQEGGGGRIVVDFYSEDELGRLVELLLPDEQF